MAPMFFSWRPKVIKIGKKSSNENQNNYISTSSSSVVKPDNVPVAFPPSISNNDYFKNSEILKTDDNQNFDNYGPPSTPRTQRVRFSDGIGNNSNSNTSVKPTPVAIPQNQPRSTNVIVHNDGPNVAPQSVPITVSSSNRSSWIKNSQKPSETITSRVSSPMAPLAIREEIEENSYPQPPRPPKYFQTNPNIPPVYRSPINIGNHPKENRANLLLQQLRSDDGALSESDVSTNEPTNTPRTIVSKIVFLQYNDEVKRSQVPANTRTIEQVKGLFLRSFPNLTSYYINLPHVKVYIQESSKGQLFYELDDVRDIKDKAVLKIREQNTSGYQSPPPVRFTDHPPNSIADYVSEPEIEDYRDRNPRFNNNFRIRPASAIPGEGGRMYNPTALTKQIRSPAGSVSGRFDPFYDPYASDTSSQGPRSGSVTPIIDKETRFRMDTMERQLAGLSTLVHSALVSKGVSESTQKDMLELRKQIMEFHPEVNKYKSDYELGSSITDSTTSSIYNNSDTQKELAAIKKSIQSTMNELSDIRCNAQLNIQTSKDIISEAFKKIQDAIYAQIDGKKNEIPLPKQQEQTIADKLRKDHLTQLSELQNSLRAFETNVETIRRSVLNSNRKLRMTEVEQLTDSLTKIGRQAAKLKTQFPDLQLELETQIKKDMERVVQEQKFIKEETNQIDSCLRRCKTLANMMVTMKKLAMVQDPTITAKSHRDDGKPPICSKSPVNTKNYDNSPVNTIYPESTNSPVSQTNYEKSQKINQQPSSHVLDTILDELNSSPEPKPKRINAEVTATFKYKIPPRPPERNQSSVDSVKHYSSLEKTNGNNPNPTYEGSNSSNEPNRLSALSSTESINSQEGIKDRTAFLTNNKDRIDDKQRELNTQLEKLQQLCPSL